MKNNNNRSIFSIIEGFGWLRVYRSWITLFSIMKRQKYTYFVQMAYNQFWPLFTRAKHMQAEKVDMRVVNNREITGRHYKYFYMVFSESCLKFGIIKQEFRKSSTTCLSIFRQHSSVDSSNELKIDWWILEGNQAIELSFFETIVLALDLPKKKFIKPSIIRHSNFCQQSGVDQPNLQKFE